MKVGIYGPLNEAETGPSRVTSGLATGLHKLGLEPYLVTYGDKKTHPHASVQSVGGEPGNVRGLLRLHQRGNEVLQSLDVDVTHNLKGTGLNADVRTIQGTLTYLKVPYGIYSIREILGDTLMSYYSRKSARSAKCVVSTSPEVASTIDRYWRVNSRTVPLGIHADILAKDSETGPQTVFLPGRISKKKGQLDVLRSLDTDRCDVHLAGTVADEDYAKKVLDHDVTYHGYVSRPELLDLYSRADATVIGSVHEFFSITALEALARSSALVITDTCGIATYDHVQESEGVHVINDRDRLGAVATDVATSDSLSQMKRAAYELASGMTWQNVAENYCRIYKDII